jgi:hypothetical protein
VDFVDAYLKAHRGAEYRPAWRDFAFLRAQRERIYAHAIVIPSIPGLVLYSLHSGKDDSKKRKDDLDEAIKTGLKIVAAVAVIAVIVAIIAGSGGTAAVVGAAAASDAAALPAAIGAIESAELVSVAGSTLVVSDFSAAMGSLTPALAELAAAGI